MKKIEQVGKHSLSERDWQRKHREQNDLFQTNLREILALS